MLFNSFDFLFFFLIVTVIYYTIPHSYRWFLLLVSSYYFYAVLEPSLLILLWISTLVDYYCGMRMSKEENQKNRKIFLLTSLTVNIGLLVGFKYLHFITSNFFDLIEFFGYELAQNTRLDNIIFSQILLPVGISFYTFQTMSYSIDIYRKKIKPEKHLGKFALYVSFFPQLVAGPIERANRLLPQFYEKIVFNIENIKKGIAFIAWGFFLKIVVADRLGVLVDEAFADPNKYHGVPLIIGAFFFAFQIYYDFSGYTSIAIGSAKVLGIDLMRNFNRPFFSKTASEFWQKWHISFMQWMRDYIYTPLRKDLKISRLGAVFIVFFINGLWHGANWTFVVWSLLNGLFLVAEIATKKIRFRIFSFLKIPKRTINFMGGCTVIGFVVSSLVFFRATSIHHALFYYYNILRIRNFNIITENYLEISICVLFIIVVQFIHYFKGNNGIYEFVEGKPSVIRWGIYIGYVFVFVLFAVNRQNTFIYFQF